MKDTLLPWMRAIAAMSLPMPPTNYLKSVDWTNLLQRSFRSRGRKCHGNDVFNIGKLVTLM